MQDNYSENANPQKVVYKGSLYDKNHNKDFVLLHSVYLILCIIKRKKMKQKETKKSTKEIGLKMYRNNSYLYTESSMRYCNINIIVYPTLQVV